MEYRTTDPEDCDYEDEDEELEDLHDYVHGVMKQTGSHEVMDSLLIIANLSEARALMRAHDPMSRDWYTKVTALVRGVLEVVTKDSDFGLPNAKLENPMLYYPPPDDVSH